jgi:ribonuclease HI
MEFRSYSVFDHRQLLRKKLDPENSFQLVLAVWISTVGEKCCSSRKKHTSSTRMQTFSKFVWELGVQYKWTTHHSGRSGNPRVNQPIRSQVVYIVLQDQN